MMAFTLCKVVRGNVPLRVECAPAFDYARAKHTTEIVPDDTYPGTSQKKALYTSDKLTLDLRYVVETTMEGVNEPVISLGKLDLTNKGHKGPAAYCDFTLKEGQAVTFILRTPPEGKSTSGVTPTLERAETLGVDLESMSNYI